MSRFWSPGVDQLTPYVPGEQPKVEGLIKLNTNESPVGPSQAVLEAIRAAADAALCLYPDPDGAGLKRAIAEHHGLRPDQVFLGNGSDEVLGHAFMALLRHKAPLLLPDISYSFYPVYCKLYGIDTETVALREDFTVDVDAYVERLRRGPVAGLVLANPNAPTGIALPLQQLERLLDACRDAVVVVDEAYVDFGADSADRLLARYPQLLVVRTLSKARALAGLRVGYALGSPELIEGLARVKDSFNSYPLDRLAQAGATVAMRDDAWFAQACAQIVASREQLTLDLRGLGFEVLPSATNFVFARHPGHDAAQLALALRGRKILVRHFKSPARIAQHLRITIGSPQQCQALVDALRQILQADPALG